jgi:hypothetical protein
MLVVRPHPIRYCWSMLLRGLGILRAVRSVVILGAGASRGASFVSPGRQVLPPLDADFFSQAQQLSEEDYNRHARSIIEFVRGEFGPRDVPTLETVFTQLEGFERFLRQFPPGPGQPGARYRKQLGLLQALIPTVFRSAFSGGSCTWHDRIALALRKGDAVISFNYDTLMDESLRRYARGIWPASKGYGFAVDSGAEEWSAAVSPGPMTQQYLRLLKPHGSLHWTQVKPEEKTLSLHAEPYGQRPAKGNVIPPTWDKSRLNEWPWKAVWQEASRYLQRARCLIVIGYSVPATDLMSQALIKSSLGGEDLRLLVAVNPDSEARGKIVDLARPGMTARTRVVELQSLREFAAALDETSSERRVRTTLDRQLRRLRDELDDLEFRIDDLEGLEYRVDELDSLPGRVDDLEAKLED